MLALIDFLEETRKGRWGKDRVVSLDIFVALFKLYTETRPDALGAYLQSIPDDALPFEPLEKYCIEHEVRDSFPFLRLFIVSLLFVADGVRALVRIVLVCRWMAVQEILDE
jgi:hypothetical protein